MNLSNIKVGDNLTVYLHGNHTFTGTVKEVNPDYPHPRLTLEITGGRVNAGGNGLEIDGAAIVAYSKK